MVCCNFVNVIGLLEMRTHQVYGDYNAEANDIAILLLVSCGWQGKILAQGGMEEERPLTRLFVMGLIKPKN
jgi:hypothetical protein